jgi:hypothetical protein
MEPWIVIRAEIYSFMFWQIKRGKFQLGESHPNILAKIEQEKS